MFYGGLAENKKDIEVPDVEPAAFLALLKWDIFRYIFIQPWTGGFGTLVSIVIDMPVIIDVSIDRNKDVC